MYRVFNRQVDCVLTTKFKLLLASFSTVSVSHHFENLFDENLELVERELPVTVFICEKVD
jgi:hypothetical protein